jgi:hypothetical protein
LAASLTATASEVGGHAELLSMVDTRLSHFRDGRMRCRRAWGGDGGHEPGGAGLGQVVCKRDRIPSATAVSSALLSGTCLWP